MKKRITLFILMALLAMFIAQASNAETKNIVIPAGSMGGSLYTAATVISNVISNNVPGLSASARASGTTENILLLKGKEVSIAMSSGMDYFVATKEQPALSPDVRSITVLPFLMQVMIVPKDSQANTVSDMKGARVNFGDRRTGQYSVCLHILDALGLKESDFRTEYLSSSNSATAFQEGKIDGNFFLTSLPAPSLMRMAVSKRGAKLIRFTDEELNKITKKYPFYKIREIKPTDMPELKLQQSMKFPNYFPELLVLSTVPDELVYNITKALVENQKALLDGWGSLKWATPKNTIENTAFKLHPGTEKYYREKGFLK